MMNMNDNSNNNNPSSSGASASGDGVASKNVVVMGRNHDWIYRDFMKEKLRVRERYWHCLSHQKDSILSSLPTVTTTTEATTTEAATKCPIVLVDGIAWRMYLPLLASLTDECHFILCESTVEWMDYRSMSPCIEIQIQVENDNNNDNTKEYNNNNNDNNKIVFYQSESPAPQERSKLQKLIQNRQIYTFCDLSIRDDDYDEWDMMGYSTMNITDRSQHALIRASGMLQQLLLHSGSSSSNGGDGSHEISTSSTIKSNNTIYILSTNEEFVSQFPTDGDGIQLLVMNQFLEMISSSTTFSKKNPEAVMDLKHRCEEEYRLRNLVLRTNTDDGNNSNNTNGQQEHFSDEQILEGLRNKTLVKGRLDISKENPKEAFISIPATGETYFIDGLRGYFNRAIHYDIVIIEPLPQSEWGRPIGRRRLVHYRDDDDDDNNNSNNNRLELDASPPVPSAKVVAIMEPSRRQFVATMVDLPMNDENACLVVPMDIRIPKIRIKTNSWRKFYGHRLLIQMDGWDIGSNYPAGHCMEILGPIADLETEISCLLRENQLHLDPFSASALSCLPPQGHDWKIPQQEIIQNRLDLRKSHRIFSVDPPGCQDIDDTMHARVLPNGDIEVGVHIADVTYFLPHKCPLDREAQVRGTTFYLVDRRFDMLPSLLSSDLCSLHGNTDRLAVSTIWTLSSDFKEIKSFWYGRTVIHNCQAMTYDQAHNIIHDKPPEDANYKPPPPLTAGSPVDRTQINELKHDLMILTKLARKLQKDREDIGGAVDLSSGDQGNELKFTLDENNNPVKVTPKQQKEIHGTIAELMILANTWVATTIYKKFPNTALLRIHQSVDEDRFGDLKEVLKAGKISFDGSTNMALAKSLKKAESESKSRSLMSLFQSLATRAMSEAQYVCTGQVQEAGLSHYGLGLEKYTHFTSPIRRYADIVVHRQLLEDVVKKDYRTSRNVAVPRLELKNLPSSNVISIEQGEGLVDPTTSQSISDGDFDETGGGGGGSAESSDDTMDTTSSSSLHGHDLFKQDEVVRLCQGINRQNRMAKFSSFECQNLFLSLYFKQNSELTQAVVTSLRNNGFWAYVPRFDFRGPVYLTDISGTLQIDPTLLDLDPSAGQEASRGFVGSGCARMFTSGKCTLVRSPEECLEIIVPERKTPYIINMLDVVTVKICCDDWDARARVPQPRLHLVRAMTAHRLDQQQRQQQQQQHSNKNGNENNPSVSNRQKAASTPKDDSMKTSSSTTTTTLHEELLKLETPPLLENVPLRMESKNRGSQSSASATATAGKPTMAGRIIFGNFRNPDTHIAKQEASIQEAAEAAKKRRDQAIASNARNNEYDSTRRIEKDVTARMQRLAAGKRNARKAKAK